MPLTESPSTCGIFHSVCEYADINRTKKLNWQEQPHLCNGQYSNCENERNRPRDHVKIGRFSRKRLMGGAQGFERCVPGISEHNKPNDSRH